MRYNISNWPTRTNTMTLSKIPTWTWKIFPLLLAATTARADWPQFRGPAGDGVSTETGWTTDWPAEGPEILWRKEIANPPDNNDGSSTVAASGGKVFAMGTGFAFGFDAESGEELWKIPFPATHSTPAVAGGKVYLYGTEGHLRCVDAATGKTLWSKEMHGRDTTAQRKSRDDSDKIEKPGGTKAKNETAGERRKGPAKGKSKGPRRGKGKMRETPNRPNSNPGSSVRGRGPRKSGAYGYACSPVILGDSVLVSARLEGGALISLDRHSGEIRWRAFHLGNPNYALWSTPVLTTIEEKPCLVWLPGPSVVGLDPETGDTLWKYDIPEENGKIGCAAASPVIWKNRVVAQYHPPHARGYTFCLEIENGKAKVAWESRNLANWYLSCVGLDGCLYGVDQAPRGRPKDMGALQCYDIANGELLWSINGFGQDGSKPVRRTGTLVPSGAFMIAGNRIISWAKELVVAEVSREGHEVLASAKIAYGGFRAAPVLADGHIFLRTRDGELICVNSGKSK